MSTARMVVIFRPPAEAQAFDCHYFAVHVPLAKKLRGLRRYEVSRDAIISLNAAAETHLIATLHFDDIAAIRAAFGSRAGRACTADRKLLAEDACVQTFLFESRDI